MISGRVAAYLTIDLYNKLSKLPGGLALDELGISTGQHSTGPADWFGKENVYFWKTQLKHLNSD